MSLAPCPECKRPISSQARSCPHCGYPLVEPWTARLERAWREGFRYAWIAAVAIPAIVMVPALVSGDALREPQVLASGLPWVLLLGAWGFALGLVAVGAAALLRRWRVREVEPADIWRWSLPAVLVIVALFGAWVSMAAG